MELVYLDGKREPYTLSSIIAEHAEINHKSLKEQIRRRLSELECYGKVPFKMEPLPSGQTTKDYILNEQQATLLITFLKNTAPVIAFKTALVKAFFEMRDELSRVQVQRALEKPKRKSLNQAIDNWEQAPKHAFSTINNLLLKVVTGMSAKKLVAVRGGVSGIACLDSSELVKYQALEDMAMSLMALGMTYQAIKETAMKLTERSNP